MSHVDLNLIRTFVILYETQSVTLTAEQLFVTQPSISYSLSKLREIFKDQLFIRTRSGMEPTTTAEQLYREFNPSIKSINNTVSNSRQFDPLLSNKRFRVAMTDLGEMALLPSIFYKLQTDAPNVELEVMPLEIDKVNEWMSSGKIDAVICSRPLNNHNIEKHILLKEHYVCVINNAFSPSCDHLTMSQFMDHKHVLVTRSLGHGATEEVLSKIGIKRKVSLELSHFSILPSVLAKAGLMAILPYQIATYFSHKENLKIFSLPFEVSPFNVTLHWSSRHNKSPSHRWFRELIIQAIASET